MSAPGQRRIIFQHIDEPGYSNDIGCYVRNGGYEVLKKAVLRKPEELIDEVKKSGLRGRGGAGFPCGVKWSLVDRKSGKPIYLIVNADESEPGTFKDRYIIHQDPHQLIEGTMISCFANNVKQAYIYIRGEMPHGARILEKAIQEARDANLVGKNILGTNYSCDIFVHRGAGAYICGEETGLIESLEGKRANPRIKPPYFPAVLGLYQCPTIVNNVETLCHVKHIVRMGGEEYAKIGRPNNTGTRILCVSGDVKRPGYYEVEVGSITLGELINDVCGGMKEGRTLKAVIPGGSSAPVVPADLMMASDMDYDSIAKAGSMLGSGAVIVMDETRCMVKSLLRLSYFYFEESCGQCTPCREGTGWLYRVVDRIEHGKGRQEDLDLLNNVAENIMGRTICALGDAAAMPVRGMLKHYWDEFAYHVEHKQCMVPTYI